MTPTFSRRAAAGLLLAASTAAGLVLAAPAGAAPVTTRYVAKTGSDTANDCTAKAKPCGTIQHAVDVASDGDQIRVGAGEYAESVRVDRSVTLTGAGSDPSGPATTISGGTGEASGPSLEIGAEGPLQVALSGLDVSGNSSDDGIDVNAAQVTLSDVAVNENAIDGLYVTGGSTVSVADSLFVGNGDMGIDHEGGTLTVAYSAVAENADGGIVVSGGTATIEQSVLDGNVGAGLVVGGDSGTRATLRYSTVSGTHPFRDPEAPDPFGAGVIVFTGSVGVENSTLSGNTGQGLLSLGGTATITNSTVAGTKPSTSKSMPSGAVASAGQLFAAQSARTSAGSQFTTRHDSAAHSTNGAGAQQLGPRALPAKAGSAIQASGTILAGSRGVPACVGAVTDGGYNVATDSSCKLGATSLSSTDPKLGPLEDNGGPTDTQIPLKGSPAIDAIPSGKAGCTAGASDQRGVDRPQPVGGRCDIGAVELEAEPIAIHGTLPKGTVGTPYSARFTATGGAYPTYTFSLAPGSKLPAGLTLTAAGVVRGTPTVAGTFHFTVSVNDPVLKTFTLVIAPLAPAGGGASTLPATGVGTGEQVQLGGALLVGGVLLLAGVKRRVRPHRH